MKLIIFDVYGTLISTGTGSLDAAKKILALQDKDINPQEFYKEWKRQHRINMDNANANLFINEEAIFICDLKQLYLKYDICRDAGSDVNIMLDTLGKRNCFDETLSSIENLRKKYRVVIGSTTDNNPLYQDLERNKLVVDEVYTSEMIRKYKPDPEFYHYILRKEKCNKEDAVFVGDSYVEDNRFTGKHYGVGFGIKRKGCEMLNLDNFANLKTIHIIKDEQTIFEYIRENESGTSLFSVGCIFKSFLSVLVGIALYEGEIGSIDDCIIDYISHDKITNINWYKLKIKHALSKTTGIVWPRPQESFPVNMREVMELEFESEPGVSFQYKPDPQIIVYLLEEVYGVEINELFRTKIVSYFINKDYEWDKNDIQGMKVSVSMLNELGQLMLGKGIINGKCLFSEEYYEQSICGYSCGGFPECTPYGLGWWIGKDLKIPYFFASGFGGQYLVVIPQKKMVISILSDMDRPHSENKTVIEKALQL